VVSDLTINISKLSEGTHQYDLEADAGNVGLDDRFVGRVVVHAELEKTGRQLHLKADLKAKGKFTCDRCLDEFGRDLGTRYEIVYLTEEGLDGGRTDEEVQYLGPDTTTIDLGEDVRQFLILTVPQKLLCIEDCRGLCTVCGANRNKVSCKCNTKETDPRWDVLKKMSLN
jgi:uncharacterized protein